MGQAKKERAKQIMNDALMRTANEIALNDIEQHNFDKLVNQGMIRCCKPKVEGGG